MAELWYRAQPSLDTFALLRRVASHVAGRSGGAVLNGVEEVMLRTGLASAQALRLGEVAVEDLKPLKLIEEHFRAL